VLVHKECMGRVDGFCRGERATSISYQSVIFVCVVSNSNVTIIFHYIPKKRGKEKLKEKK
jgi:hypothetical protein